MGNLAIVETSKEPKRRYPRPEGKHNIQEAATFMEMSRSQFNLIKDKIPHMRYSPQCRIYDIEDLKEYKQRHKVVPKEEE